MDYSRNISQKNTKDSPFVVISYALWFITRQRYEKTSISDKYGGFFWDSL